MKLRDHHQRTTDRLARAYRDDAEFRALIIGGSVAKGCARNDHARSLFERVRDFRDWGVSDLEAYTWFMTDVEWSWMSGTTPMEDW